VLVVGFWQGVALARVLKFRVLQTTVEPFVQAARGLGVPAVRRLTRHIAPEVATTLGPSLALTAGSVASLDAALAFMRLEPVTEYPSWGSVLAAQAASGHLGLASGPALLGFSLSVGGLYWLGLSIGTRFGTGWAYELFKARLRS
jgi:ABC-type dipeptide/oligopeptide/nickel transport system permease subunit